MTAPDTPRRLVVRLPNWLGDVMMALPALAVVRQAFPDAFLALAASSSIAPVFEEHTAVRQQQRITVDKATEAASLREGSFDTILLLTNSFRSAWIARRSGIPKRWGYAAGVRGPLLTTSVPRPRKVHQSEFYLRLVEGLGVGVAEGVRPGSDPSQTPRDQAGARLGSDPGLTPSEGTRLRTLRLFEQLGIAAGTPLVGFAPGAAYGHAKRWPPDRVARRSRRRRRRP